MSVARNSLQNTHIFYIHWVCTGCGGGGGNWRFGEVIQLMADPDLNLGILMQVYLESFSSVLSYRVG